MKKAPDKNDKNSNGTTHVSLKRKSCPLSCDDCNIAESEPNSLEQHLLSETHQRALVKYVEQRRNEYVENDSSSSVMKNYETISNITSDLENNLDKITQLSESMSKVKDQVSDLSKDINEMQEECSIETKCVDALSLNQRILIQNVESVMEKLDNRQQITRREPDGSMIWRITGVQEKICDAQSERQTNIYSPAFYTSNCDYRLCGRLYLNGDGNARGTDISIFLVVLRGEYDSLLKWPFSYRVSFCLYDQRTIINGDNTQQPKHIIGCFRPDTNSSSFRRPCSSMNIASGISRFCSIDQLDCSNNNNPYIINDTMYIKILIDFVGLPRSILPMIFNMNIGLPESIQQKLISDELQRQNKQNSN